MRGLEEKIVENCRAAKCGAALEKEDLKNF
jgi:hypothetical protein